MKIPWWVTACASALLLCLSVPPIPHVIQHSDGTAPAIVLSKYAYAHATIDQMTLEQKIGQLLFIPVSGPELSDNMQSLIFDLAPGGIVLFASNIRSETQTARLTADMQEYAHANGMPDLFIAVDEEGGIVERISFSPAEYSQPQLGHINNPETTRQTVNHTATVLTELGINVNFAPVADIAYSRDSVMTNRSFGSDPDTAALHVGIETETYVSEIIMPTAKHFPGHGRTAADSHEELPTVQISKETWYESDAKPFVSAIEKNTPFIMSGHLLYPHVDPNPASTSSVWLKDILREEMGYNGIIIADDIKMEALRSPIPQTAIMALTAGNDMIVVITDPQTLYAVRDTLVEFFLDENAQPALDASLVRILATKYQFLLDHQY